MPPSAVPASVTPDASSSSPLVTRPTRRLHSLSTEGATRSIFRQRMPRNSAPRCSPGSRPDGVSGDDADARSSARAGQRQSHESPQPSGYGRVTTVIRLPAAAGSQLTSWTPFGLLARQKHRSGGPGRHFRQRPMTRALAPRKSSGAGRPKPRMARHGRVPAGPGLPVAMSSDGT